MDNEIMDLQIVIKFDNIGDLNFYLADMEAWKAYKVKRSITKLDDKRGRHTKLYHQKARHYHSLNPELTYRECMALIKHE